MLGAVGNEPSARHHTNSNQPLEQGSGQEEQGEEVGLYQVLEKTRSFLIAPRPILEQPRLLQRFHRSSD